MKLIYLFFYLLSLFTAFGSLGYVIFKVCYPKIGKSISKKADLANKLEGVTDSFENKKVAALIYFAQKGYIKIRRDDCGEYHIDKIADFSGLGEYKEILESIYKENVTYYGDENAIMSYESVNWADVKNKYRDSVEKVAGRLGISKNTTVKKEGFWKDLFRRHFKIDLLLFINWVICCIPVAYSNAMNELDDGWAVAFAFYFVLGVLAGTSKVALFIIKKIKDFKEDFEAFDSFFGAIIKAALILIEGFLYLLVAMLVMFGLIMFVASGEIFEVGLNMNFILGVILAIVTIILVFIKRKFDDPLLVGILDEKSGKKNVDHSLKDKNAVYADLLNQVKTMEKQRDNNKLQPEWYEGEEWSSVNDLILQLNKQ